MQSFRSILAASALVFAVALPAFAETSSYVAHDMRASKLLNITVLNDKNEKIGTIEDIVLPANGGEASAVLTVDSMVGSHKMVKVPLSHVHVMADRTVMPGADGSKTALLAMQPYTFGLNGGGG